MIVKVGIDATEYQLGLKKMESFVSSSMMNIGRSIAGAFTVGAVTAFTVKVAKAVADVADLADQMEITTDQVQALQRAALGSGVALDTYASALQKIRKAQADFRSGDKGAVELFNRLGVDPNQGSFDILKKLGFTEDKASVFDLLGVRSAKLFNSLKDLRDLDPFERVSEGIVRKTDSAFDRLAEMKRQILAVAIGAGSGLVSGAASGKGTQSLSFREIVDRVWSGGGPNKRSPEEDELRWSPHVESNMMPGGYTKAGRSSGWAGPMQQRALGQFSPINLGDRANVGGFFGPNADVNRKMQQNIESMNNEIKAISKVVVSTAQTAP